MTIRVFIPPCTPPPSPGDRVQLESDEVHYLLRVRRARVGASLELLDGAGAIYRGTLLEASPKTAVVGVEERLCTPEVPRLSLAVCMPETAAALELVVGASELGATRITWVRSTYSHGHPPTASRIARVLRASMRQCGRPTPPDIAGPLALTDLLETATVSADRTRRYIAAESLRGTTTGVLPSWAAEDEAILLVGPEGGFHDLEIEAAREAGWMPLSLGPWTLRTPTAVLAGLSRLLALWTPV